MKPLIAAAAMASMLTFGAVAQEFDSQFQRITLGLNRDGVIATLGAPDAATQSSTVGVPHAWARWNRSGRAYTVRFVYDLVVATKICTAGVSDC